MGIVSKEEKKVGGVLIENLYHDSSSLLKTSYNHNTGQLTATFVKGNVYIYNGIPIEIYEELKTAESSGSYFSKNIAKSYNYHNLGNIDNELITEMKEVVNSAKNL